MIAFGYAVAAKTAVLRSCRLDEIACLASHAGLEQDVIVGIIGHPFCVVLRRNVMAGAFYGEIGEEVRKDDQQRHRNQLLPGKPVDSVPQKEKDGARQYEQEDDLASPLATMDGISWRRQLQPRAWCIPGRQDSARRTNKCPVSCSCASLSRLSLLGRIVGARWAYGCRGRVEATRSASCVAMAAVRRARRRSRRRRAGCR